MRNFLFLSFPLTIFVYGCSSPPDLSRAEQFPYAPNQAVLGCAGYFETQYEATEDTEGRWDQATLAKSFFILGGKADKDVPWTMTHLSSGLRYGFESVPFKEDTLYYRDGHIAYRDWYYKDSVTWDSIQHWSISDKDFGTFQDSIISPPEFTITHDPFSKSNPSFVYLPDLHCDSIWLGIMAGKYPKKGKWLGSKYTNDHDLPVRTLYYEKIPFMRKFVLDPSVLDSVHSDEMVGLMITAQTAKISKHFGKWYVFRSTSAARLNDFVEP